VLKIILEMSRQQSRCCCKKTIRRKQCYASKVQTPLQISNQDVTGLHVLVYLPF